MNIADAILLIDPNAVFVCVDNDYGQIDWSSDNANPKPALADVQAASITLEHQHKVTAVKAETQRRIFAVAPAWQQQNLQSRAIVLTEKGRANWTVDELAEWDAGMAIWGRIMALRTASDIIEALDPIPDPTTALEWPE